MKRLFLLVAVQFIFLLILAFVPFGFDKPSAFGLDLDHFLFFVFLYCITTAIGVAIAIGLRRWWAITAQLALIIAALVILFWPMFMNDYGKQPPAPPDIQG
jgi:hypothetical protein